MAALTTRMMKIVPASRFVSDASLEPPNIDRRRAIGPAGEAGADSVSITATARHPRKAPRGGGDARIYQRFVKIRLGRQSRCRPGPVRNCARGPGPIATGSSCLKKVFTVALQNEGRGVWVPAFAGTTR